MIPHTNQGGEIEIWQEKRNRSSQRLQSQRQRRQIQELNNIQIDPKTKIININAEPKGSAAGLTDKGGVLESSVSHTYNSVIVYQPGSSILPKPIPLPTTELLHQAGEQEGVMLYTTTIPTLTPSITMNYGCVFLTSWVLRSPFLSCLVW